jgi:glycosyltransferase involved in cell wall biosynthesis
MHVNGATANGQGPITHASVTVVIPAKNEAENVAWVLRRLPDDVSEVVLVDGRSTDDTVAVARAERPDLVVALEAAPGKGAAMRTGMELARGEVIVTLDADGSMDPREIARFVAQAASADLVKGSRFAPSGGSADITVVRKLGNRVLCGLVNLFYGSRLTDLCYGFCAVRRSALPALGLRSDGFEIETEMTVRALRAGLRIAEVPSFELPRRYGRSHLRAVPDGCRVLTVLVRERFRRAGAEPEPAVLPLPAGLATEPAGPVTAAVTHDPTGR